MSIITALQGIFGIKTSTHARDEVNARLEALEAKWFAPQQSVGDATDATLMDSGAFVSLRDHSRKQQDRMKADEASFMNSNSDLFSDNNGITADLIEPNKYNPDFLRTSLMDSNYPCGSISDISMTSSASTPMFDTDPATGLSYD